MFFSFVYLGFGGRSEHVSITCCCCCTKLDGFCACAAATVSSEEAKNPHVWIASKTATDWEHCRDLCAANATCREFDYSASWTKASQPLLKGQSDTTSDYYTEYAVSEQQLLHRMAAV
jgi:GH43 family beta-xylosidase